MKLEKEITVLVTCTYPELHQQLLKNKFQIKEEYIVNDIYMIAKDTSLEKFSTLEILQKCILVREIEDIKKVLLYKYKKYSETGDILEQGKVECPVVDIERAVLFMEAIGYQTLFKIYDKNIVYANEETELVVQLVNNQYVFIEMDGTAEYVDRTYETIEEMKKELVKYQLPYDASTYFAKKAEMMLQKVMEEKE
ncbi:MAG: hypothetical protein PHN72_05465 [Bacilli bacterium]|nr:hypothetical protein [Bacilli bacterium]